MLVLNDAIDTRKPAILEPAIDCIQRMISFKLLHGPVYSINHKRETAAKSGDHWEGPAPLQFAAQPPQAQAIELLCRCDDIADEAVELRLLKALLTAVTSASLSVHGQALLLVVRTCHNIHLTSRNDVNQSTAKATLTQMLNVVFQRMEAGSTRVVVPPIVVSDLLGGPSAENSNVSAFVQQFLYDVATQVDPFGYYAEGVQQGLDDAFSHDDVPSTTALVEGASAAEASDSDVSDIPGNVPAPATVPPPGSMETQALAAPPPLAESVSDDAASLVQQTLQKDAFLVFRALCKLSIRSMDVATGSEVATVRGKVRPV
jgi:brefeldin A-inhibited guanine nucleotide-exchange protein